MFHPGPHDWEHTSVGGPYCGVGNDSVSAGDCRIHRRQVLRKMKRRLTGVAVAAVLALLAAAYLWGPGSAPRGQEPVVTLSEGILRSSRRRSMPTPTFHAWSCCCLQLDQPVCGGPPQLNKCWRDTPPEWCACLWYGNRSSRRTGGHPVAARSRELQTTECASSGTRSTSCLQN